MDRVKWHDRFGILARTGTVKRSTDIVLRIPTRYDPIWQHIDLSKVFDAANSEWRRVWHVNRPEKLSLSQRRGENIMDLLSAWNKAAYGESLE